MINLNKFPLLPRKAVFEIQWIEAGAVATVSFVARQFIPGVETADCSHSTIGQEELEAEDQAHLYRILATLFECDSSKIQLGADEAPVQKPSDA